MNTIFKFPVQFDPHQSLFIQDGVTLLTVQMNFGKPTLWALVDPVKPRIYRHIEMYGTGAPIPAEVGMYLGTVQYENAMGTYVYHFFGIS